MIFVGYDSHSKAYRCYNPVTKGVSISRDVKCVGGYYSNTVQKPSIVNKSEVYIYPIKKEDKLVQDEHHEELIDEEEPEYQVPDVQNIEETPVIRRSQRLNRGIPPRRLIDELHVVKSEVIEPKTYTEAIASKESEHWIEAMEEEIASSKKKQHMEAY